MRVNELLHMSVGANCLRLWQWHYTTLAGEKVYITDVIPINTVEDMMVVVGRIKAGKYRQLNQILLGR